MSAPQPRPPRDDDSLRPSNPLAASPAYPSDQSGQQAVSKPMPPPSPTPERSAGPIGLDGSTDRDPKPALSGMHAPADSGLPSSAENTGLSGNESETSSSRPPLTGGQNAMESPTGDLSNSDLSSNPTDGNARPSGQTSPERSQSSGVTTPLEEKEAVDEPTNSVEPDAGERDWDFLLPRLPPPAALIPGGQDGTAPFSLEDVASAMQNGWPISAVNDYASYYHPTVVAQSLQGLIQGFPLIFYAIETNKADFVRFTVGNGGDPNAIHVASGMPALAFAVVNSDTLKRHTTDIVKVLLGIGAKHTCFPEAFYNPFCEDLPVDGPPLQDLPDLDDDDKTWCRPDRVRAKLARAINLSQRYYLDRAARSKPPTVRHRQVAARRGADNILGIQYFLIGQSTAAASLKTKLLTYMTLPSSRPLVLVFAGKLHRTRGRVDVGSHC